MGSSKESVGMALAKWLIKRAIVRDVFGPFENENKTIYRVAMNDGSIISITLGTFRKPD